MTDDLKGMTSDSKYGKNKNYFQSCNDGNVESKII